MAVAFMLLLGLAGASRDSATATSVFDRSRSHDDRHVYRQVHMGVEVRLVLYAATEAEAAAAARTAFAEIARLDAVFSDYRQNSELSRLSEAAGAGPVTLSPDLHEILRRARRLAEQTDGGFNVAAGALTLMWRRAIRGGSPPSDGEIEAARRVSGVDALRLVDGDPVATLPHAGTRLDLGGIAKGHVLERARIVLAGGGAHAALFEAGGDVVVGDPPPGQAGWRVRIAHTGCVLEVANAAISTSGDTEQFVVVDGVRYSHTVDPRTGRGLTGRRIATVIAADGATADSLATALTVVEGGAAMRLMAAYPDAVALVSRRTADGGSIEGAVAYGPAAVERFAGCMR